MIIQTVESKVKWRIDVYLLDRYFYLFNKRFRYKILRFDYIPTMYFVCVDYEDFETSLFGKSVKQTFMTLDQIKKARNYNDIKNLL